MNIFRKSMLKFKAYRESNSFALENLRWENVPFVKKQEDICTYMQEKIVAKERKAKKIYIKITETQSNYMMLIEERDEKISIVNQQVKKINDEQQKIGKKIEAINILIKRFDNGEPLGVGENIVDLRQGLTNLKKQKEALRKEENQLLSKPESIKEDYKKILKPLEEKLQKLYRQFTNRIDIVKSRTDSVVVENKSVANYYVNAFWACCIKRYVKNQKKKGCKLDKIVFPKKPDFNSNMQTKVDIFAYFKEKKQAVNQFNNDVGIKYSI